MRIVAGRFKGRAIKTPSGDATRPTSDRVRQAVFNILEHGEADVSFDGANVLDLFAGSGALGLEALSRGAAFAVFVDTQAAARAAIRENTVAFGIGGETRILKRDARDLGPAPRGQTFDICFLDPPYGQDLVSETLAAAMSGGWLRDGTVVIAEVHRRDRIDWPTGIATQDQRTYGDTRVDIATVRIP